MFAACFARAENSMPPQSPNPSYTPEPPHLIPDINFTSKRAKDRSCIMKSNKTHNHQDTVTFQLLWRNMFRNEAVLYSLQITDMHVGLTIQPSLVSRTCVPSLSCMMYVSGRGIL